MIRSFMLGLLCASFVSATTAPAFRGELINGDRISLSDKLDQKKMVLLSFWASWCVPCMEELRQVGVHMAAENLNLEVLTVNVDTGETSSGVKATVREQKLTFPVVLDPKHEIFTKYSPTESLPFSVLIAPDGTVVKTFNGYRDDMFTKIKEQMALQVKS